MDKYRAVSRSATVRDMINILLAEHSNNSPVTVNKNWFSVFIQRYDKFRICLSKQYNYQYLLNKDPNCYRTALQIFNV